MNKQSENHEEVARIVDQLQTRKASADAMVMQSSPQVEHAYNQISGTLIKSYSDNEKKNKENIEKNQLINSEKQSDVATDLTERYRLIAQKTSDLIAFTTFDANAVYTFVSPSHKKILGYTEEDLLGKSGLDFVHDDDKQPLMTLLLSYIDAKINNTITPEMLENIFKIDYRIRDKFGNWHFLRSTVDLVGNEMLFISKDVTVQKQIEDALRKSEEKFLKAFKSSPVAIAINRINDGTFLEVNKSLEKLIGYTRDELLAQRSLGLNVWVDSNDRKNLYKEIVKTGSVYDQEYRFRSKSGDVIVTRYSGEAIDFSDEQCILSVLFDITNSKKAEELLRKSEEKYRLVVENAMESITIAQDGMLKFANQSTFDLFGYSQEEIMTKPFIEFVHPDDCKMVMENHIARLNGEKTPAIYPFRIKTKKGMSRWIEIQPVVISWEEKPATLNFLRDITEQKEAQEALKKSEEKFVKAFRSSPVAICITRVSDGRFLEVNKALEKLIGYTRDELLVQTTLGLEIWVDISERKTLFDDLAKNGSVYDREYRFRSKKGEVIYTHYCAEVIDFSGEKSVLSVLVDITQSKNSEQILKEKIEELERYKNVTINREIKMVELKNEINELCKKLNQKSKYANISQNSRETEIL